MTLSHLFGLFAHPGNFLSISCRLKKKQFQLLGAAAIFLASKLIEPSPVSALTLVKYTADTYDKEELLVSAKTANHAQLSRSLNCAATWTRLRFSALKLFRANRGPQGVTDGSKLGIVFRRDIHGDEG